MKIFLFILCSLITIYTYSDTLYVSNTLNSGPGSLRQNISDAQNYDIIEFDMDFFQNADLTIELDSQINITKHLIINGTMNINDSIVLSGKNNNRIFNIENSIQFTLNNLIIKDGFSTENGGAMLCSNNSNVYLNNCIIRNSEAQNGGAICTSGNAKLNITNCKLKFCKAQNGGAISTQDRSPTNSNTEIININNSTCEQNEASENGGCINISGKAYLNINQTIIRNCQANNGGGISDINSLKDHLLPHITLNKVYMHNNHALESGGAIFTNGCSSYSGFSKIELNYSSLYKNTAGIDGGGISVNMYSAPQEWGSGGEYIHYTSVTSCEINNSTLVENYSPKGSSIKMKSKVNSAVKMNQDKGNASAFTVLKINNSTIKGVDSLQSNEILLDPRYYLGFQHLDGLPEVEISSSILANPGNIKILECQKRNNQTNAFSNVVVDSSSYNIYTDSIQQGTTSTDLLNVHLNDINFSSFENHGGLTPTLGFKLPSIAHNNGNPNDLSTAQNKPIEGIRDIGAFENCNTYHPISETAFNTFTWIDGKTYTKTDSNIYFEVPTGPDCNKILRLFLNIILGNGISIYPNPSTSPSTLQINYQSPKENLETIQLINSMGKVIFRKNIPMSLGINRKTILIPEVSKGVYILQMVNANINSKLIIH